MLNLGSLLGRCGERLTRSNGGGIESTSMNSDEEGAKLQMQVQAR
jgi:hypothetical protein